MQPLERPPDTVVPRMFSGFVGHYCNAWLSLRSRSDDAVSRDEA